MVRRASLVAAFLACVLFPADGAFPPVLRFPVWACSDGNGTISLFWLPTGGEWPAGGYRLERVSRGRTTVLGGPFRPGQDALSMMALDAGDADAVRSLADKIGRATLTDDDRNRSISGLGRSASADAMLGRALGVRFTDVPRERGKLVYRLTALRADGGPASVMESAAVEPGRPTQAPAAPRGLRAEQLDGGVALFWSDPPASAVAPVVGYRVARADGGRRATALTPKPLLLDRHLRRGEPEFLDGAAPARKIAYEVRSVDVFGRLSAPARAGITVKQAAATMPAPASGHEIRRVPATDKPATVVWGAPRAEPAARRGAPLPKPRILEIVGMGDRVVIRFKPGEPEGATREFLVYRSESPAGIGMAVGQPIPGNAREWADKTVSAGQYFWYRLVAVDAAGNRGEPSAPKWVSTSSR